MVVAGLIFSNLHDSSLPEMTRLRTIASVPIACRYRLVDFPLSSMVNSGITNVGIIAHKSYNSLLDHIGNGKDWDLARRSGGVKFLPPYVSAFEGNAAGKLYEGRLEAIINAGNFASRSGADYLVMSDCNTLMNLDVSRVVEDHINSGAYLTLVTKKLSCKGRYFDDCIKVVKTDGEGRITSIATYKPEEEDVEVCTNVFVISRQDLETLIATATAFGYTNFTRDVIQKSLKNRLVRAYAYDGWYAYISSLGSYFDVSMRLLKKSARDSLFLKERPIYTKLRNSAPTKYKEGASVRNSLVADGCIIEGEVENSVLFRGVHVGRGTKIKNSILLQDTFVGRNADINCLITDKNVIIKDSRRLSGHESMPFFIKKGEII